MADQRGRKRPPDSPATRRVRRQLADLAIDRSDRDRARRDAENPNKMELPTEVWNTILQFTDLKTVSKFAQAHPETRALALFSNVKAVSDAIRDVPTFWVKDEHNNRHTKMLIENVLFVLGKYASEIQLEQVIKQAYPHNLLMREDFLVYANQEGELAPAEITDPVRLRIYGVDALDNKARMLNRLVGRPVALEVVMDEIAEYIGILLNELKDDFEDFEARENFDNEAEFVAWRISQKEQALKMMFRMDDVRRMMAGEEDSVAELREHVPFYLSDADRVDPEMKRLRMVVGFVWQAMPRNKELPAKREILAVIGAYRTLILQLRRQDSVDLRTQMSYAGVARFGGPMVDYENRLDLVTGNVLTRTGHLGPNNFFLENQHPDPTMGFTPEQLLKPLGELVVDTVDKWAEDEITYVSADVIRDKLQAGMVTQIKWWQATTDAGYAFYYNIVHEGFPVPTVAQLVAEHPFSNLAEFLDQYLYQSGDLISGLVAGLTYSGRLVAWHKNLLALIASVVPELGIGRDKDMQMDAYIGVRFHAKSRRHMEDPDDFAFYNGVRRLARSHWKRALTRR